LLAQQLAAAGEIVLDVPPMLRCLHFATHCSEMYAVAPANQRPQMNQAVFEKFYVDEDGVLGARLSEPFDVLLDPHLLVETDTNPESETDPVGSIDALHRNADWSDGAPGWLRDGAW
jgi:hypothetical protein